MATSDGVAIAVTVVATLVVVALAAAVTFLLHEARGLRRRAAVLAAHTERLLVEVEGRLDAADAHLGRVDDLIGSAESLGDAVSSASRLASAAVAGPVIKVMALGAGAARAKRRLQQGPDRSRR